LPVLNSLRITGRFGLHEVLFFQKTVEVMFHAIWWTVAASFWKAYAEPFILDLKKSPKTADRGKLFFCFLIYTN